jgi:hypothetical protein
MRVPLLGTRQLAAAALIALAIIAPSALAGGSWNSCRAASGGAMNTRVSGLSCGYAGLVTENGLRANGTATRLGAFHCRRHRAGERWVYHCARAHGRQAMTFETY